MTKKLLLVPLALLLAISLIAIGCPAEETTPPTTAPPTTTQPTTAPPTTTLAPIVLTFATEHPAGGFHDEEIYKPWFAAIEEATGGRVKIEPYYSDTLVSSREAYPAILSGLADFAHISTAHAVGKFPMTDVMLMTSYDKVCWKYSQVYWELYQKFPEMQAEYAEVKVLTLTTSWPVSIATVGKPIRELDDWQGLKLWGGGKVFAMREEILGAASAMVTPPEMYTSLEQVVVDGGPISLNFLWQYKLGEVVDYMNMVPFTVMPVAFLMNLDKWNSLPADVQNAIDEVSGTHIGDLNDRAEALYDREARQAAIQEFGIEFIDYTPEELARWVEADKPVAQALIAELEEQGLPGTELFEEYWRLEDKYCAPEYEPK